MENEKTKDWINKAKLIHGDLYDYSKTNFINHNKKVQIICKMHGEFLQQPASHTKGMGCLKCSIIKRNSTTELFIEKAKKIHGDLYDYSKVKYINALTKIIIICKIHGEFLQTPKIHLSGSGCSNCGLTLSNTLVFIEKAKKIHGDLYDYSLTKYEHSLEKVIIICKNHGKFYQTPKSHLISGGCPKCGLKKISENNISNTTEFIGKAKKIHGNLYDYSFSDYTLSSNIIHIICPIHGDFEQLAYNHLSGSGCPKCAKKFDKSEILLTEFIKSLAIKNIITNDKKILNGKELDIYLPDYNLAIEFNGLYWHSDKFRPDNYHLEKTNDCLLKGIQLIHIFEDEFIKKPEIVYSRLRNLLGKSNRKIYARKTKFVVLNTQVAKQFLETNHIQGFTASQYYIGLATLIPETEKYELVSVMTFGKLRKNLGQQHNNDDSFELVRFCNKLDTNVIGGASKLLNYFIKNMRNNKPTNIISYADKRWSQGKLYETLGFTLSHESKPNYFYVQGLKRINRFNYRKDILVSKYNCPITDTERNFTKNVLGMNRIYDCGTYVYKLSIQ